MSSFNSQFLYSVTIILLGYILKRTNLLQQKDGEALARIIFNITMPCLIIVTFSSIKIDGSLILLLVIGIVYGLLLAAVGVFVFRKDERKVKGMLTMMIPGFNIGMFAYPLVEGIWGKEGLKYFGMFDVGNAFVIFVLCYVIGSYYSGDNIDIEFKKILYKVLKSMPLLTYVIICLLAIIGIHLPSYVLDVSVIISKANMPLSLLLLGVYLNFSFQKSYLKKIIMFLSIRYVIGLGVGIALFFLLPFEDMFRYTILVCFILPVAGSVLPYAVEFKYDQKFVGTVSNMTILLSFLLLWGMTNVLM